jgi:hypothetical protein
VKTHPTPAAIPHTGALDAHRPNPRVHRARREGAIAGHRVAALGRVVVGIWGEKRRYAGGA